MTTKSLIALTTLMLLTCANYAQADFILVPIQKSPEPAIKEYTAPSSITEYGSDANNQVKGLREPITFVGTVNYLAQAVSSNIQAFDMSLGDILLEIVPSNLSLELDPNIDKSKRIAFDSSSRELWVDSFKNFNVQNSLWAIVDWDKQKVTIGRNIKPRFEEQPIERVITDSNGDEYVIRKKTEDYQVRSSAGLIVNDGEIQHFKSIDRTGE